MNRGSGCRYFVTPGLVGVVSGRGADIRIQVEPKVLGGFTRHDERQHLANPDQEWREVFQMRKGDVGDSLLLYDQSEGVKRRVPHRCQAERRVIVAYHPRY